MTDQNLWCAILNLLTLLSSVNYHKKKRKRVNFLIGKGTILGEEIIVSKNEYNYSVKVNNSESRYLEQLYRLYQIL